VRQELENGARMGDPASRALLEAEGEPPDSLRYLLDWADRLARARTVGPHGVNGFTDEMIRAWAANMDVHPLPHEVDALLTLDVVMRFPDAGPDGAEG
jgi:hypothetical protein